MGTVEVAEAVSGLDSRAETHFDQPKHAFGCCPICTQRLRLQQRSAAEPRRPRSRAALPTTFLVQTSVVPATTIDEGRR